jgi:DNA-binding HxlR family transcriptional regulator
MKRIQPPKTLSGVKDSLTSVREALAIIGGKWKIPILVSLACGEKRFKEIQYDMDGVSAKVLSRELKELEMNELILRSVNEETGIVMYSATKKCKSLEKIIEGLKEWGDYHRSNIFHRSISTKSIPGFTRERIIQNSTAP